MMEFKNAVFAGGGSRCLWQVGFWDGANRAGLGLYDSVDFAASTSAGCAMAAACLLNRGPEALETAKEIIARNPSNIHWHNLKPGSAGPLLPHPAMYQEILEAVFQPDDLEKLANKQLEFLMAKFPDYLPTGLGTVFAFVVYGLEKRLTGKFHPVWTQRIGFTALSAGNQDVSSVADLIEVIRASSCVPPVLSCDGYNGERVLDGGLIDNVPAHLADGREGRTLVLLSKRYKRELPKPAQRVYVQPSEPIKIDKFEYANAEGLQEVYDLGLKDGEDFANKNLDGLNELE